ncbi:hypothetical protein D6833_06220 [Candidatus Parcubacteria bacterium]|nr:MAG: hypothetical protein D6833_06220 [Candidatus Parcubacteria bacterium]
MTQMRIVQIELPLNRIFPYGTPTAGPIGHYFDLKVIVRVDKRPFGVLIGRDVQCPVLQWRERIEWFEGQLPIGGHRGPVPASSVKWRYVGHIQKDMYAENPGSLTFRMWHQKFTAASLDPPNHPPPGLKAAAKELDAETACRKWIAEHGFEWCIPGLTDKPGMGLTCGSRGGGGDSLVISNTRRRVVYFDLGFSGFPTRIHCVQILESVAGRASIHKFIAAAVPKSIVDNETYLQKWRNQLTGPQTFTP